MKLIAFLFALRDNPEGECNCAASVWEKVAYACLQRVEKGRRERNWGGQIDIVFGGGKKGDGASSIFGSRRGKRDRGPPGPRGPGKRKKKGKEKETNPGVGEKEIYITYVQGGESTFQSPQVLYGIRKERATSKVEKKGGKTKRRFVKFVVLHPKKRGFANRIKSLQKGGEEGGPVLHQALRKTKKRKEDAGSTCLAKRREA